MKVCNSNTLLTVHGEFILPQYYYCGSESQSIVQVLVTYLKVLLWMLHCPARSQNKAESINTNVNKTVTSETDSK